MSDIGSDSDATIADSVEEEDVSNECSSPNTYTAEITYPDCTSSLQKGQRILLDKLEKITPETTTVQYVQELQENFLILEESLRQLSKITRQERQQLSDELENTSTTADAGHCFQQQLLQLSNKQKTLLQCFDNQKRLGSQLKVLISNQNHYSTRSKTSIQQVHSQEHASSDHHRNSKTLCTQVEAPKVAMVTTSHYRRYKPVQPVKSPAKLPSSSQLTTSVVGQLKQSTVFGNSKVSPLDIAKQQKVTRMAAKNQQSQNSANQQVTLEKSQMSVGVVQQQKQHGGMEIHSVSTAEQKQGADKATPIQAMEDTVSKTQEGPTPMISHQQISASKATQQQKLVGVAKQQQSSVSVATQQQKLMAMATKQQKPAGIATQQQKLMGVATQQQKPVIVATQQQKPAGVATQQQKLVGVAKQQQKPVGIATQQQKLMGVATQQQKLVGVATQQKFMDTATQQQELGGMAKQQQKPVGVAAENQSMETDVPQSVGVAVQHQQPLSMQQPVSMATPQLQSMGLATQQVQPLSMATQQQPMETDTQLHLMGVAMCQSQVQQPVSMQQARGVATKQQQRPMGGVPRLLLHSELAQPVPLDVLIQHQLISPQDQCLTCTLMGCQFTASLTTDSSIVSQDGRKFSNPPQWLNNCWATLGHNKRVDRRTAYTKVNYKDKSLLQYCLIYSQQKVSSYLSRSHDPIPINKTTSKIEETNRPPERIIDMTSMCWICPISDNELLLSSECLPTGFWECNDCVVLVNSDIENDVNF